jgi:AbrB family looped-hinge helix DNA binding protein
MQALLMIENDELPKDSTLTEKGQTTIPKMIRDHLDLKPGDQIRFFPLDGYVRMVKVREPIELLGCLSHTGITMTDEEIQEARETAWSGSLKSKDEGTK